MICDTTTATIPVRPAKVGIANDRLRPYRRARAMRNAGVSVAKSAASASAHPSLEFDVDQRQVPAIGGGFIRQPDGPTRLAGERVEGAQTHPAAAAARSARCPSWCLTPRGT